MPPITDRAASALRATTTEGHVIASVKLGPGEYQSGIELTLEPHTQVEGRLVDPAGKPFDG